ncbi:MAG: DUF4435 domain-containing protein [Veillonella sp.]|nr:DUF4435 domain-containing protein [Veillonella sp.]
MTRRDKMCEESECLESIFMSYITSKAAEGIFLFFEGKDDFKYYIPRITINVPGKVLKKFDCGNKSNVIQIHKRIKDQSACSKKKVKLFFVDKDFDTNENIDDDIYITPTYSIENLYFTDIALEHMLKGEIGLSDNSKDDVKDFDIAFNYIKEYRDCIINNTLYGNAYYSLQIRKSKERGINRPNLTSIKGYDQINGLLSRADFERIIDNYIDVTDNEVDEECQRLRSDPICLLRGKYILEKLPECINTIVECSNRPRPGAKIPFSKRRHMALNISKVNLLSVLSQYAETPDTLITYIRTRCNCS